MENVLKMENAAARAAARVAGVLAFAFLVCLGAFVRIPLPFSPVPLTGQTFFVLLSGAMLGASGGAASQLLYILLGWAGFAVFSAAGSGTVWLASPTAGYIFGFVPAALVSGSLLGGRRCSWSRCMSVFVLSGMIVLACGACWLRMVSGLSFFQLMLVGVLPFVPGDIVKASIASAIYMRYVKFMHRVKEDL